MEHYIKAVQSGRLCSTVEEIREHFYSVYSNKGSNSLPCEVCRENTVWRCELCEKLMCTRKKKGWNGGKCIFQYHNHDFFGLSRSDHNLLHGKELRTWTKPNDFIVLKNARKIVKWRKEIEEQDEDEAED